MFRMLKTIIALGILAAPWSEAKADLASGESFCISVFSAEAPLRAFEASRTVSQKVRDNAPDFWQFSRESASEYFGHFLKYQGLVVGDTHPGNFIVAPIGSELRFHIADLKDAGFAPFALDFTRLVLSTHAIFKRVTDPPKLKNSQ